MNDDKHTRLIKNLPDDVLLWVVQFFLAQADEARAGSQQFKQAFLAYLLTKAIEMAAGVTKDPGKKQYALPAELGCIKQKIKQSVRVMTHHTLWCKSRYFFEAAAYKKSKKIFECSRVIAGINDDQWRAVLSSSKPGDGIDTYGQYYAKEQGAQIKMAQGESGWPFFMRRKSFSQVGRKPSLLVI